MGLFNRKEKKEQKPSSNYELLPIYKDKDGRQWFEFANKMNVPAQRAIAAEVATRFAGMNLTRDALSELLGKCKEHANGGDIVQLLPQYHQT